MNSTPLELNIERIVRDVLKRIEAAETAPAVNEPVANEAAAENTAAQSGVEDAPAQAPCEIGQLELTDKVISLRQVEGRLGGVRHIIASAQAVVTPSVRDYLKQLNIRLTLRRPDAEKQSELALFVATFASSFDIQQLCDGLTQRGVACGTITGSLPSILDQLAPRLAACANAVLVTRETEVALCAANRRNSVRAFAATGPALLERNRQTIGGNLLIVDPAICCDDDIRDMASCMAATCEIPSQWHNLL